MQQKFITLLHQKSGFSEQTGHVITKHDVDKFLSESNRPLIKHLLLIATTDRTERSQASLRCTRQTRHLLSDFDKSAMDYPAILPHSPSTVRHPRFVADIVPHPKKAKSPSSRNPDMPRAHIPYSQP